MNKKHAIIYNTVLIPCTRRKLPASVQAHFSMTTATTPTVPETRSIRHCSHLLGKSLKILNAADNFTVAREAHCVGNIRWAAIDSGASGNYFPSNYQGEKSQPTSIGGDCRVCERCSHQIKSTGYNTKQETTHQSKNMSQI